MPLIAHDENSLLNAPMDFGTIPPPSSCEQLVSRLRELENNSLYISGLLAISMVLLLITIYLAIKLKRLEQQYKGRTYI
jgi:hypothetical protein